MNRIFVNERVFSVAAILITSIAVGMVACCGQTPEVTPNPKIQSIAPVTLSTSDLIGARERCDHVITLLHQYGGGSPQQHPTSAAATSSRGPVQIPNSELGDLQILSTLRMPDVPGHGPRIAVVVANQSVRCVKNCSITAVAMLSRIYPDCPTASVCIDEIAAGQNRQVEITLPLDASAMGNRFGQPIGFQRLLIAVDSFDEFAECDEANNLQVYAADTLPRLVETATHNVPNGSVRPTGAVQPAGSVQQSGPATLDPALTPAPRHPTQPTRMSPTKSRPTDSIDPLQDAISQFDMTAVAADATKPSSKSMKE